MELFYIPSRTVSWWDRFHYQFKYIVLYNHLSRQSENDNRFYILYQLTYQNIKLSRKIKMLIIKFVDLSVYNFLQHARGNKLKNRLY